MGENPIPAVSLKGVAFAYDHHPVLRDVDLEIAEGDFVSVIGPNGGGKSTLLRLMLGLLSPDRGTVRVFGAPPAKARLQVGYMPQHAQVDHRFPVTAMDVALMGRLRPASSGGPLHGRPTARPPAARCADTGARA